MTKMELARTGDCVAVKLFQQNCSKVNRRHHSKLRVLCMSCEISSDAREAGGSPDGIVSRLDEYPWMKPSQSEFEVIASIPMSVRRIERNISVSTSTHLCLTSRCYVEA
jgi:hypothetical protein